MDPIPLIMIQSAAVGPSNPITHPSQDQSLIVSHQAHSPGEPSTQLDQPIFTIHPDISQAQLLSPNEDFRTEAKNTFLNHISNRNPANRTIKIRSPTQPKLTKPNGRKSPVKINRRRGRPLGSKKTPTQHSEPVPKKCPDKAMVVSSIEPNPKKQKKVLDPPINSELEAEVARQPRLSQ